MRRNAKQGRSPIDRKRDPTVKKPVQKRFDHRVARNDLVLNVLTLRAFKPAVLKPTGPGLLRASIMRDVQREQRGRLMDVPLGE